MNKHNLLEPKIYIQSCKDYTNGLCPKCHDEFNMVESYGEAELDYNHNIMFIPMSCPCGLMFIQILELKERYDRSKKIRKPIYEPTGYSHLCDCDNIDLIHDNCLCEDTYKETYTKEYDRYLILKPRYSELINNPDSLN